MLPMQSPNRNFLSTNSEIEVHLVVTVPRGVVEPGVVGRAAHARLQVDGLAGHLLGRELARVRHPARGDALHRALLPPRLEVLGFGDSSWVLDPLNYLSHSNKIDIIVALKDFIDPVQESFQKFGVVSQPSGVEVQTERRTVLFVVAVEIVVQEVVELITGQDVRTRVYHSAAWKIFVVVGVLAAVELVHDHFPHGVASGRAALQVAVAAVRHSKVHCVWP